MAELIFVVCFLALWVGTIIYAKRKHPERFTIVLILCLLGGPVGYLIALIMISTPKQEPLQGDKEGVEACPHCNALYRVEDYRTDVAIFCSMCKKEIRGALT